MFCIIESPKGIRHAVYIAGKQVICMDNEKKVPDVQVTLNLDTTPILYTDNISMTTNEDGIVLDVMQRLGPTNQVRIVSRIGMSRSHAKKFLKELGSLLAMTDGQLQTGKKN